jgi:hypothetical protein
MVRRWKSEDILFGTALSLLDIADSESLGSSEKAEDVGELEAHGGQVKYSKRSVSMRSL